MNDMKYCKQFQPIKPASSPYTYVPPVRVNTSVEAYYSAGLALMYVYMVTDNQERCMCIQMHWSVEELYQF